MAGPGREEKGPRKSTSDPAAGAGRKSTKRARDGEQGAAGGAGAAANRMLTRGGAAAAAAAAGSGEHTCDACLERGERPVRICASCEVTRMQCETCNRRGSPRGRATVSASASAPASAPTPAPQPHRICTRSQSEADAAKVQGNKVERHSKSKGKRPLILLDGPEAEEAAGAMAVWEAPKAKKRGRLAQESAAAARPLAPVPVAAPTGSRSRPAPAGTRVTAAADTTVGSSNSNRGGCDYCLGQAERTGHLCGRCYDTWSNCRTCSHHRRRSN